MTEQTKTQAKATKRKATVAEAEVIDAVAVEVEVETTETVSKGELVSDSSARAATRSLVSQNFDVDPKKVAAAKKTINLKDSNSVITFGVGSQKQVSVVTDQMLEGVRNKDLGPVTNEMTNMVVSLRKMDFKGLQNSKMPKIFKKILGMGSSLAKFQAQYDTVASTVAKNEANLQNYRMALLKDVKMLDTLYERTLERVDDIEVDIVAGEEVLEELANVYIPEAQALADSTQDMADYQALRDIQNVHDSLERKIHDLKLTRQITIQSLPSIRIVQDNDRNLAEKIQNQIYNTIPLWKQQMVIATSVYNGQKAVDAVKANREFTNELIVKTSSELQKGNNQIRQEIEAGIADIESISKANENLIATIEESLAIAEQGKQARIAAEQTLKDNEDKLKQALSNASTMKSALADLNKSA